MFYSEDKPKGSNAVRKYIGYRLLTICIENITSNKLYTKYVLGHYIAVLIARLHHLEDSILWELQIDK